MALNLRTEFYPKKENKDGKKTEINTKKIKKKRTSCYSGATYW